MKTYPSIPGPGKAPHLPCKAFRKYDGSNIRAEWSKKRGWYKFGTRKTMFDETHEFWGPVIELFHELLAEGIEKVLKDNKKYRGVESVIAFSEFFGPNSFAGSHSVDDVMTMMLFDLNVHKKGFVAPNDFVKDFGHLKNTAEVIYDGILNKPFIEAVKNGDYPQLEEGVVCKGGEGHKLWMVKVKTAQWIAAVKRKYPSNWQEFHSPEDEA
jgi:hypothetical protein